MVYSCSMICKNGLLLFKDLWKWSTPVQGFERMVYSCSRICENGLLLFKDLWKWSTPVQWFVRMVYSCSRICENGLLLFKDLWEWSTPVQGFVRMVYSCSRIFENGLLLFKDLWEWSTTVEGFVRMVYSCSRISIDLDVYIHLNDLKTGYTSTLSATSNISFLCEILMLFGRILLLSWTQLSTYLMCCVQYVYTLWYVSSLGIGLHVYAII